MEVDNDCEMVKEQQQMIQPEDSMVLGESKLAGSEATSQDKVLLLCASISACYNFLYN